MRFNPTVFGRNLHKVYSRYSRSIYDGLGINSTDFGNTFASQRNDSSRTESLNRERFAHTNRYWIYHCTLRSIRCTLCLQYNISRAVGISFCIFQHTVEYSVQDGTTLMVILSRLAFLQHTILKPLIRYKL